MNDLKEVKARARALVGDPDGDFMTDSYLLPLVNQAYEMFIHSLMATPVLPIHHPAQSGAQSPQGTTWLADAQKPDEPSLWPDEPALHRIQAGRAA